MTITEEKMIYDNIYPYVLSVPSYVKNQNNDIDFKLITILKKGIDIINSPLSKDVLIHEDEEFIFDSVKRISEYITNRPANVYNTNYLYDLLLTFFDFCDKKIQFDTNIINLENYNKIFNEYYSILLDQEKIFISNILDDKDQSSFEDLIFNHMTEETLVKIENYDNTLLTVDEFLDELEKW